MPCGRQASLRVGTLVSYPTLLKALATPWDSVEQCSMGTLSLVPRSKVALSRPTLSDDHSLQSCYCLRKLNSMSRIKYEDEIWYARYNKVLTTLILNK